MEYSFKKKGIEFSQLTQVEIDSLKSVLVIWRYIPTKDLGHKIYVCSDVLDEREVRSSKADSVLYIAYVNLFLIVSICRELGQLLPCTCTLRPILLTFLCSFHHGIDGLRKKKNILQTHHSTTYISQKISSDKVIRKALC